MKNVPVSNVEEETDVSVSFTNQATDLIAKELSSEHGTCRLLGSNLK